MAHSTDELDASSRIQCRGEDNFLKEVPVHMVGARKGEKETLLIQQTKGPEIEIFISLRSSWKMPFLFGKGRRVKDHDIVPRVNASHHLERVSSNQPMGDFLQLIQPEMLLRDCQGLLRGIDQREILCTS